MNNTKNNENKNNEHNYNNKTNTPIILTSALPYTNGFAHLGHILEMVETDVIVRALKLDGKKVTYCCASDTHGTAIEIKAKKENTTPEELVEKYGSQQLKDFKAFGVEYDSYYTTNSPENKYFADLIFKRLKDKGLIYQKEQELIFCEFCKRFLPDRFVKGTCPKCGAKDQYGDNCEKCNATYNTKDLKKPFCVICKNTPIKKNSTNYFFKLSKFSDQLKEWLQNNKNLQSEVVNQVMHWINEGLQDWCISRDGPYFGFKIPGEEDKFYYVWLDAPIGYISSLANFYNKDTNKALKVWNNSDVIHIIGKDIIYFHLLFWPAMLWGANLKVPKDVIVHGFITEKGEKMSKSRGALFTASNLLKIINPEHIRFYLAHNLPRKMSDFGLDLDEYQEKINGELVGNIANFFYRTLSFCNRFFDSKVLPINKLDQTDASVQVNFQELKNKFNNQFKKVISAYNKYELRDALDTILAISKDANKYFQDNEPWKVIKEDKQKAHELISFCINLVKNINTLLKPVLPKFTLEIEKQLNLPPQNFSNLNFNLEGTINKASIILKNIDDIDISQFEAVDKEAKNKTDKANESINDSDNQLKNFAKLNLRVAKITKVEDHPNADKLYKIQISLGPLGNRQICAGIKPYLSPEELLDKHLIVVSNLKTAKLRGELSEGMLLAAQKNKKLIVIEAPFAEPGTQVLIEGITPNQNEITIDDFAKIKLTTKNKQVVLKANKEKILVAKINNRFEAVFANIKDNARIS